MKTYLTEVQCGICKHWDGFFLNQRELGLCKCFFEFPSPIHKKKDAVKRFNSKNKSYEYVWCDAYIKKISLI